MAQRITVTMAEPNDMEPVMLGHQGENLATVVEFDISAWVDAFGEGTAVLLNQRKGEAPYIASVTREGDIVSWTVTNVDTGKAGSGWCELQYYVGDALAKSDKRRTITKEALETAGDAPEPWEGFIDQMAGLAAAAEESAESAAASAKAIEDMTVSAHAVTLVPTVDKTVEKGVVNLDFGIPSGGGGALPPGGASGQILVKNSALDGDASWQDLPVYDGSYEVTPLVNADTLMQTEKTYLDRDVVVKAIPYQEVSNGSGGLTITIGG